MQSEIGKSMVCAPAWRELFGGGKAIAFQLGGQSYPPYQVTLFLSYITL
jgi:hypothetical protein